MQGSWQTWPKSYAPVIFELLRSTTIEDLKAPSEDGGANMVSEKLTKPMSSHTIQHD